MPVCRAFSAKVTSRIALATATPTAMIAPMNDWMFSVVWVMYSAKATPATTAGVVATDTNASLNDWKYAVSIRNTTTTASARPLARPLNICRIGGTWPRIWP